MVTRYGPDRASQIATYGAVIGQPVTQQFRCDLDRRANESGTEIRKDRMLIAAKYIAGSESRIWTLDDWQGWSGEASTFDTDGVGLGGATGLQWQRADKRIARAKILWSDLVNPAAPSGGIIVEDDHGLILALGSCSSTSRIRKS